VAGAGGWGTALAVLLAGKGIPVTLWARRPEIARALERDRENTRLLPGVVLPPGIAVTADPVEAMDGPREAVILAIPMRGLREACALLPAWRSTGAVLVSTIKGLEPATHAFPSRVLAEALGAGPADIAVLSGPSHAEEVGRGMPTAVVVASTSGDTAARVQALFHTPVFRVYRATDVAGVETAGALKNVVAIACGIAAGLGFGDNSRAALITRGLVEMTRLGVALGGRRETFQGLAGLGDLVVTCTSPLSRNRTLGTRLGRGEALEAILAGMQQVAEGVEACRAAHALARARGVTMPITAETHAVLFEGRPPRKALEGLLSREPRTEEDPATGG
jgi:glycerol-3-phosphate dehydrogenase (NAD(P)+)